MDDTLRGMFREIVRDEIGRCRGTALRDRCYEAADRSDSSALLMVEDVEEMTKVTEAAVLSWIKAETLAASRRAGEPTRHE